MSCEMAKHSKMTGRAFRVLGDNIDDDDDDDCHDSTDSKMWQGFLPHKKKTFQSLKDFEFTIAKGYWLDASALEIHLTNIFGLLDAIKKGVQKLSIISERFV